MFSPEEKIMVVGVGGRGISCLERWIENGLSGVETLAVDSTDFALLFSHASSKINIGSKRPTWWSTCGRPELGRLAAEESETELHQALSGAKKVIINAGLGSGTGTGAAPVVARIAKEAGAHTVSFVTRPFNFEGSGKIYIEREGIIRLLIESDLLVIFPNDLIFSLDEETISLKHAFNLVNDFFYNLLQDDRIITNMRHMFTIRSEDLRDVISGKRISLGPD